MTAEWDESFLRTVVDLPGVILKVIVTYLYWDWPDVGCQLAAMDTTGMVYHATVLERKENMALIKYANWHTMWNEWISKTGFHLTSSVAGPSIFYDNPWPRLRKLETLVGKGVWHSNQTGSIERPVWTPDPIVEKLFIANDAQEDED